ncbi:mannose/glucose-specific lectin-like [Nicotiana tabacum]|uniref:Mannose/glucose-specific lectin-like n=1 Tax=Nicotiana tabacum TaxID=4097 RepID=A0AC58SUE5_TOBAC
MMMDSTLDTPLIVSQHSNSKFYFTSKVTFEKAPLEYLTGITGTLGRFNGHLVVKSLCFITNVKSYGPFDSERVPDSGKRSSFHPLMKDWAIVGFYRHAGSYLDAIGIYLQKITRPTLPEELEFDDQKSEEGGG